MKWLGILIGASPAILAVIIYLLLCGVIGNVCNGEQVPDYRNGKPNALVCPNNRPCFQCGHATAKRYVWRYVHGSWDGGIVFLPLDKKP